MKKSIVREINVNSRGLICGGEFSFLLDSAAFGWDDGIVLFDKTRRGDGFVSGDRRKLAQSRQSRVVASKFGLSLSVTSTAVPGGSVSPEIFPRLPGARGASAGRDGHSRRFRVKILIAHFRCPTLSARSTVASRERRRKENNIYVITSISMPNRYPKPLISVFILMYARTPEVWGLPASYDEAKADNESELLLLASTCLYNSLIIFDSYYLASGRSRCIKVVWPRAWRLDAMQFFIRTFYVHTIYVFKYTNDIYYQKLI